MAGCVAFVDIQQGEVMAKKRIGVELIMDLMKDYEPRTSEQIAELTGVSHGRVRSLLVSDFCYEKERRRIPGGGVVTYHSLKRQKIKPKSCLEGVTT